MKALYPTARLAKFVALAAAIAGLTTSTALAETFELANGEKFEAEVLEQTDEVIVVEHPVFGRLEVPKTAIKKEEVKQPHPGLFGTRILRGWKRNVGLGFNGASGNSASVGVNASLGLNGEGSWYIGKFSAAYFFGENRDNTTGITARNTNSAFADYRHDILFGESPFFVFLNGRYDYDEFQDFVNRATGQGGGGIFFIRDEKIEFKGSLGAGVNRSWGTVDTTKGELVAGLDFLWNITEGQKLVADTYWYPNLQRWSDIRLLSNVRYEIALGFVKGLSLNFGLNNEYRSEVAPPVAPVLFNENNNLKYYGALAYEF